MPENLDDQELITGDSSLMNPLQSILGALSDETFRSDVFGDPEQLQMQDFVPGLSTAREATVAANRFKEAKEARSTIGSILRNTEGAGHALLAASDFATPGIPLVGLAGTFGSTLFKSFEKVAPKLDNAIERLMKGEDANKVRQETGFFIAGDGLPRYEFSDRTAKVNFDRIPKNSAARVPIKDFIAHDILYDEYPDLEKVVVKQENNKKNSGSFQARFDHEGKLIGGTIWVDPNMSKDEITSTMLHEIQHWIQTKERIAEGSNVDLFKSFREQLPQAQIYKNTMEKTLDFARWFKKNPERAGEDLQTLMLSYSSMGKFPGVGLNHDAVKAFVNGDISLRDLTGVYNSVESDVNMMKSISKEKDGYNYYRTMGEVEARDVSRRWEEVNKGTYTEVEGKEFNPVLAHGDEYLLRNQKLHKIPQEDQLVIRMSDENRARNISSLDDIKFARKIK